jgi:hypothetical protein
MEKTVTYLNAERISVSGVPLFGTPIGRQKN